MKGTWRPWASAICLSTRCHRCAHHATNEGHVEAVGSNLPEHALPQVCAPRNELRACGDRLHLHAQAPQNDVHACTAQRAQLLACPGTATRVQQHKAVATKRCSCGVLHLAVHTHGRSLLQMRGGGPYLRGSLISAPLPRHLCPTSSSSPACLCQNDGV